MKIQKAFLLIACCSTLLLPSCVSSAKDAGRDLLTQARADLSAAGKDIAREVGLQLREAAKDVVADAKGEFLKSGGDIKEAVSESLKGIPDLAKGAGERAAVEAIAKRIEVDEPAKAAQFRETAAESGLPEAWKEFTGGGIMASLLAAWGLRNRKKRIEVEAIVHDSERQAMAREIAEAVVESKKAA